ncbi:bile acid 7-alpha dehydratase [Caballeronia novacaledonica]|uniref:Bile acid 7-alpha dehydratase n=1 Tax=Caballeronia novacaledonica TaxID=1544861 RepID=A0A2U3IEB7_9BURK|nr:nuclear transport factor 2 family protein [Caballeronia novacaledonica]SPB18580.1 bile acid 7-alpha dehydratase [Caballeronia novacaledonica]
MTPTLATLDARLAKLEAIDAIRTLKARYAALADAKYTNDYRRQPEDVMRDIARQQAACFTEDAVWIGGAGFGDDLTGRARLASWFERSPWRFAMHYYVSETLHVTDANHASGTWRLWQLALRDDDARAVLLGAVTEEKYARSDDGRWLISEMRFAQLHMMEPHAPPLPLASDFASLGARRNFTAAADVAGQ